MNPTRNVRYIEVAEDIFYKLCENRYDETVKEIQQHYFRIKQEVSEKTVRWMKVKGEDCFLETKNKILFPDTRKMKPTDLRNYYIESYDEIVTFVKAYEKEVFEGTKKQAEDLNCIIPSEFDKKIAGLDADALSISMAQKIFDDESCPCFDTARYLAVENGKEVRYILTSDKDFPVYDMQLNYVDTCKSVVEALKISAHKFPDSMDAFEIMVRYGLYPESFGEEAIAALQEFHEIVKHDVDMEDFDELRSYLRNNSVEKFLTYDLRMDAIENDVEATAIDLSAEHGDGKLLRDYFDECDYIRGRIQKYNAKWYLSDEGRGHWELWGESKEQPDTEKSDKSGQDNCEEKETVRKKVLQLKDSVVARNPIVDVRHDAVVGIDFGTKSTIVALQDGDEQIVPLRVGMADYSVAPEAFHFENPTVMQFVNLSHFMKQYNKFSGRPMTSWDDLLISHEAFENLIGAEESTQISSFVTEIKQWAAGKYGTRKKSGHLIIKDANGYRYDIDNYMELTEEDIDLVELYAYYIGLFINNMHTGIYLDYLLSFPETFSVEIRNHILESFTKGIRKSLPTVVLEDSLCAEEFRVRQGPSEPAAYAACALEEYGVTPTDEGIFYGIFDFGGGTTDYDYGIWKNAPEDEYTYNYVIRHYGSGGDKTLGGENILQLLAYEIFSDDSAENGSESNREIMRKNKLSYYRPEDGKVYSGTEALNNNGESALLNTKQLMEALRPIWEEWPAVKEWFHKEKRKGSGEISLYPARNVTLLLGSDATIKAKLFLFSDNERIETVLNIDMAMVNRIMNDRIESGVRNFFEGLRQAYAKWEKKSSEKIHIFLAGNSSRSMRVIRLFSDYIEKYSVLMFGDDKERQEQSEEADLSGEETIANILNAAAGIKPNPILEVVKKVVKEENADNELLEINELSNTRFILYPPLGTETAREIQKERGLHVEENNLMAPTGKTGVAFGLIMCREGSMIKVESETKKSEQIKLNYYIGVNYRKHFRTVFDRSAEYHKWLKFSKVAAETETFEFYYSELPEVNEGDVEIKDNKSIYKHKCLLDNVHTDACIFFRFVNPTYLEYVAALEDKVESGEYLSKIYSVKL